MFFYSNQNQWKIAFIDNTLNVYISALGENILFKCNIWKYLEASGQKRNPVKDNMVIYRVCPPHLHFFTASCPHHMSSLSSILFSSKDLLETVRYPPSSKSVHMYLHSRAHFLKAVERGWNESGCWRVWSHGIRYYIFLESEF